MVHDDPAVEIAGRVDDVAAYYHSSSVCIAPLLSGSGTRLKILEAMSFGNPVVSTSIGAEGIEAENGHHILLGDKPEEFAAQLHKLLPDKTIYNNIREAAATFVKENYDWPKLGLRIDEAFTSLKNSA
jgi:glycosyltransferase involved in cell wall biosynthesis